MPLTFSLAFKLAPLFDESNPLVIAGLVLLCMLLLLASALGLHHWTKKPPQGHPKP